MSTKNQLICVCLLLLSGGIEAQTPPSAGSELQQIQQITAPRSELPSVQLPPNSARVAVLPDGRTVLVHQLRISGAQAYTEVELLAISGFSVAGDFSLEQLRAMAERITQHYHRDGYFASHAYLPEQDIVDGVVRIQVQEGRYGRIHVQNQSAVNDALPAALLHGIESDAILDYAQLESRLLLLSDLPGVSVNATLAPAAVAAPGRSDLLVSITPKPSFGANLDVDNEGNRYTGMQRIGATFNLQEPSGLGDLVSLRLLSTAEGLDYAHAAYQLQFGRLRASVAYTNLRYSLGQTFANLHANGTAEAWSLHASYPLMRSRSANLTLGLAHEAKRFIDQVDATATRNDKRNDAWVAQLNGEQFDDLGGGGRNGYSITWTSGELKLSGPSLQAADALSLQSHGHFDKLGFFVQRLQHLSPQISALLALTGQLASKNLDASEQIDLGGVNGVRAYPQGETAADQAYVLNLELRWSVPCGPDAACGRWQWINFVDSGSATLNKQPWTQGLNTKSVSGIGLGLQWTGGNDQLLKAYYAWPLVNIASGITPEAPGRLGLQWIQTF
jgi:hemolysin activation/secretion protein